MRAEQHLRPPKEDSSISDTYVCYNPGHISHTTSKFAPLSPLPISLGSLLGDPENKFRTTWYLS